MKFSTSTLAAVGAVALSALVFAPAQAAPTYTATLGFNGMVVADTCQLEISGYNLGSPVPLQGINGQTLPIPLDDEYTFQFTSNGGHTTNRQAQTIRISGCPSAISTLKIGWAPASSTFLGNGVLSNIATSNASTNVNIKVSANTGGGWHAADFQNGSISLDLSGPSAQFQLGAQFQTSVTPPTLPDPGNVKANVGITLTYQ